ncbi:heterokaryon incompatibility [Trichoderma arundinaceum]|uniref:Heterokaryon incompatibility n=1 Tax=Trichoderma arundinaceum TaxID=490622 RepID=A0A395NRB0_TRIAR|nr:heterokaryon incompatibility [Trichoderma arundinaceum]
MCKFIFLVVSKEHAGSCADDDHIVFRNIRSARLTWTKSNRTIPSIRSSGIYTLNGALESHPDECIITLRLFAKREDPIATIVHQRPFHRNVQSSNVFAAARSLIKKCMDPKSPHKHCQYSRDTVLPLRVLDVGTPKDLQRTVKLRINETEIHAPYLALSYCWGKQPQPAAPNQPLQLRRDNLQDLVNGIKLENLQQSIQDAIFATRKLGFCYLWVDALCIIQDCKIDKDREISRMASIYKNATVTIAASSSANAADGFLSKKIQPYCPNYEVHVPMPDGRKGTVYLSAEAYEPEHPLDKRGWTLQEFMLSSRMLIFSDYELLWQCKEVDLQSVSERGLEYLQPLETLPWAVFDDNTEPYFGNLGADKVYLWKTIVRQYTERKLTDSGDRLRAITGITCELETLWHDVNIYGLWKKWFIELLAWYKPNIERERKRYLVRAPSWSWASLNGVIYYEAPISSEDAKVRSLTISTIELTGRILQEGDIDDKMRPTISERPDLIDPIDELQQSGLQDQQMEYLLLGTVQTDAGRERGIGLLVVDVGRRVYRRIGLAIFRDMTIWESMERQAIELEAKLLK